MYANALRPGPVRAGTIAVMSIPPGTWRPNPRPWWGVATLAVVLFQAGGPLCAAQAEGTLVVRVESRSAPAAQAEVRTGGQARGRVSVTALTETPVVVELEPIPVLSEDVVVTTTRTTRRVQDLPLRVDVVPQEEIDGLRVVGTSPSLGAASVRVQGLRGRYTQLPADGLPSGDAAGIRTISDLGRVKLW